LRVDDAGFSTIPLTEGVEEEIHLFLHLAKEVSENAIKPYGLQLT